MFYSPWIKHCIYFPRDPRPSKATSQMQHGMTAWLAQSCKPQGEGDNTTHWMPLGTRSTFISEEDTWFRPKNLTSPLIKGEVIDEICQRAACSERNRGWVISGAQKWEPLSCNLRLGSTFSRIDLLWERVSRDLFRNNSQKAIWRAAMTMDALRYLSTRKAVTIESSSKSNSSWARLTQGIKERGDGGPTYGLLAM